ncbi:MAG TPA: GNAT family N-acetyltransferase [Gammaproteobacteria bacterium]|jgi:GNAT superfamily N-acetyltransferase
MPPETPAKRAAKRRGRPLPTYRFAPQPSDVARLRELVAALDVFNAAERDVALELLEERLRQGEASGYFFVLAEIGNELVGYAAWGPAPMTQSSFDLYWIAVHPRYQSLGIGRELLAATERAVAEHGGGRLYIETSSRIPYARTRTFYAQAAYREVARLENFYAEGDAKIIYCKPIGGIKSEPS